MCSMNTITSDDLPFVNLLASFLADNNHPHLLPKSATGVTVADDGNDNDIAANEDNEAKSRNMLAIPEPSPPISHVVLCGSAILHTATTIFSALPYLASSFAKGTAQTQTEFSHENEFRQRHPHRQQQHLTLVICGGIGHSTSFLYTAVSVHPVYKVLYKEIMSKKLSEADVFLLIGRQFWDLDAVVEKYKIKLLVDRISTNCGANAVEARKLLDAEHDDDDGNVGNNDRVEDDDDDDDDDDGDKSFNDTCFLIVQDPTMSQRTKHCFIKTFLIDTPPVCGRSVTFIPFPTFTPSLKIGPTKSNNDNVVQLEYNIPNINSEGLWPIHRFLDLLLGEIPRLRNDEKGYGPNGSGFIGPVEIPVEVEEAWIKISRKVRSGRGG